MPEGFKQFFLESLDPASGFILGQSQLGINELGPIFTGSLQIHPTFEYSERVETRRFMNEAETGHLSQSRLEGGKFRFSIPLNIISDSDANNIRFAWKNDHTMRFSTVFSGGLTEFVDCRIINVNDPFRSYTRPLLNNFDGMLTLLSVNDQNTGRGIQKNVGIPGLEPFILDDAVQGILDNQTYRLG